MEDVQNRRDERRVAIDRVGVTDLRYPITVLDRLNKQQHTIATLSMSVSLAHELKGTHMSRFIEVLNQHRGEVTMRTIPAILEDVCARLNADSAHLDVRFPYFLERSAPISSATALMDYECVFRAVGNGGNNDFVFGVKVPVTSLCPCSKTISDYGAHNQRGEITVEVRSIKTGNGEYALVWFEELIEIAERSASAPVYPLLKRADERYVTMQAYDNPAFVEDMVRNVAVALQKDERIDWFQVHAVNHESIHNHGAFAEVEWHRGHTRRERISNESAAFALAH
jgi:GTP cyclohydrolase IB